LPEPVGASSSAFSPLFNAVSICTAVYHLSCHGRHGVASP
jgi:hypothetical protein